MMLCRWVSPTRPLGSKSYDVWECRTQASVMIVPTNKTRQVCVMSWARSCVTVARSGTAPNISGCRLREDLLPNTNDNAPNVQKDPV